MNKRNYSLKGGGLKFLVGHNYKHILKKGIRLEINQLLNRNIHTVQEILFIGF